MSIHRYLCGGIKGITADENRKQYTPAEAYKD
jgi:hypothetical protein